MKKYFKTLPLVFFFSILWVCCNTSEPNSPVSDNSKNSNLSQVSDSSKNSDLTSRGKLSHSHIESLPPNLKREGPFSYDDQYIPVDYYTITGYWPGTSCPDMSTMKNKYGFSGICIDPSEYSNAIAAGFAKNNIMIRLSSPNWSETINNNNYAGSNYYIGEPIEHNPDGSFDFKNGWVNILYLFPTIRNSANSQGGRLIVDGYQPCIHLQDLVLGGGADIVMFSSYKHWYHLYECSYTKYCLTCSGHENLDQRDDWSNMRSLFTYHFSSTWVGGNGDDSGELSQLIGHARNLGLNQIWLMCGNESYNSDMLSSFCFNAWENGYLRRVTSYGYFWYKCTNPTGVCDPESNQGWVLYRIEYLYSQEVFP